MLPLFPGSVQRWPGRRSPLVIHDPPCPEAGIDVLISELLRNPVLNAWSSVLKVKALASPRKVGALLFLIAVPQVHMIKVSISMED